MKMLIDFMDLAAKQRCYSSFKDFKEAFRLGAEGELILAFMIEVADKYAMYARGEGFEQGWEAYETRHDHFGEIINPYKRYM